MATSVVLLVEVVLMARKCKSDFSDSATTNLLDDATTGIRRCFNKDTSSLKITLHKSSSSVFLDWPLNPLDIHHTTQLSDSNTHIHNQHEELSTDADAMNAGTSIDLTATRSHTAATPRSLHQHYSPARYRMSSI